MSNEYIVIYDSRSYSDFRCCTKIEFFDTFKDALKALSDLKKESEKAPEFVKNIKGVFQKVT